MADTKITDLTEKVTGAATDEFVINDVAGGNADKKMGMDGLRITASQVTDFDTEVSNNTDVTTNTAKVSNATHTGDVTGSVALTIADDAVTYAKMQNVSGTNRLLGRDTAGSGIIEEITAPNVRSMLNVEDGANNYSHPNHTGDVTSTGDGATVISAKAVDIAMLADGTDGELITWGATGVAETVAVGTSGHVLTSNGVGLAPTFQAVGAAAQTPWGSDIDADGFDLTDLSNIQFRTTTGAPAGTVQNLHADAGGINLNVPTADTFDIQVNAVSQYEFSASTFNINGNTITNTGVLTLPTSTDTLVGKATTDTFTNKTFDANGTGNSLSNVDVADLANGTDGELITWDATGAPATVAVGTSGHVLTSNGVGAAPTFQAAGGASQTPWTQDIDADTFALTWGSVDAATPAGTVEYITNVTAGLVSNVATGGIHDYHVNNVSQMTISATTVDFQANTLTDIADITSITSLNGVAIGNYILTTDNSTDLADTANIAYLNTANTFIAGNKQTISQSATTSGLNLGAVSTAPSTPAQGDVWYQGSNDALAFRDAAATREVVTLDNTQTLTNKTLTTPTIASFTNATHNHTNAAGGGQIAASTALSDFSTLALVAGDVYTGVHDFGGATSLEIPNATSPDASLTVTGRLALDTSIASHDPMLKYYDGAQIMIIPAIPLADLTTTDNDVIAYSTANTAFTMEAQAGGGGSGTDEAIVKAVDQSESSATIGTTLTIDDELVTASLPVGEYTFECRMFINSANSTPGFNYDFGGGTLTATGSYQSGAWSGGAIGIIDSLTTASEITTNGTDQSYVTYGRIVVTVAGTFGVRWAQKVSSASNTTVLEGSSLIVKSTGSGGGGGSQTPWTSEIDADGFDLVDGGIIKLREQAAAETQTAGAGQIWVKTATPNELWFSDDAGTDYQIGGGTRTTEFAIPLVQEVPEGTVGYPDIHDLVTASAHVSGMVLPDGASASTINLKTMHPIPDDLAGTPAARIEFVIMTKGAVAGPADVRLRVASLAVADTENFDQAFTAETETTVTMPTATETQDVYSQDMTSDPVAGDTVLVQLRRDPTDAADDFTDDIQIVSATLWIQRST